MCLFPRVISVPTPDHSARYPVTVSCGECLECLIRYSKQWAFRICHEASLYKKNCFITLTYNSDYLPSDGGVHRRDIQLFIKRLRRHLEPLKIRYFYCGEYGSLGFRPHYHIIIFNWCPDDLFFLKRDKSGSVLYRSLFVERCWSEYFSATSEFPQGYFKPMGFCSVGMVDYQSAKYCAKYLQKSLFNRKRLKLPKPFVGMSNRPGIGYDTIYDHSIFPSGLIYYHGKSVPVPRYYLKVMERDGIFLDEFKFYRSRDLAFRSKLRLLPAAREKIYRLFGSFY